MSAKENLIKFGVDERNADIFVSNLHSVDTLNDWLLNEPIMTVISTLMDIGLLYNDPINESECKIKQVALIKIISKEGE